MPLGPLKDRHIVAIGGGHGLGQLLSALAPLGRQLCGIVATTDDGGSTGRLRASTRCIAWGDIRNCLNRIVGTPSVASLLLDYRFQNASELSEHSLGNLMLLALDQMSVRPTEAVQLLGDMLHVTVQLLPMADEPTSLVGYRDDGVEVVGEVDIATLVVAPKHLALSPPVKMTKESLEAVQRADILTIGPGSFLTSLVPPLLTEGMARAFHDSAALKLFIENVEVGSECFEDAPTQDKLQLLEKVVGPLDGVLWPQERGPQPNLSNHVVFSAPLRDASQPGVHDKAALRAALVELCGQAQKPRTSQRAVRLG